MITALLGVPGKLKTLLDRLTSTRAGYLDNLSAGAVAPASTALSTATWTNARAGYLDKLNISGNIVAEDTPLLDVPIASGLDSTQGTEALPILSTPSAIAGVAYQSGTNTTYSDRLNYTGQGVLQFACVQTNVASAASIKIVIDGVTCIDASTHTTNGSALCPVGAIFKTATDCVGIALDAVPFKTSCQIQAKGSGAGNHIAMWKVRKTA